MDVESSTAGVLGERDATVESECELEPCVRDLAPRLIGYCTLELRDATLAEDVAQEALGALVQRWRRLGPPESPVAFVFAIARRRCARTAVRRKLLLPIETLFGHRDAAPDPEQRTIAHAEHASLMTCLSKLRPSDRRVLLLLAAGGLSIQDVAAALRISVSAVKMRAMRARHRLQDFVEEANVPRPR